MTSQRILGTCDGNVSPHFVTFQTSNDETLIYYYHINACDFNVAYSPDFEALMVEIIKLPVNTEFLVRPRQVEDRSYFPRLDEEL